MAMLPLQEVLPLSQCLGSTVPPIPGNKRCTEGRDPQPLWVCVCVTLVLGMSTEIGPFSSPTSSLSVPLNLKTYD